MENQNYQQSTYIGTGEVSNVRTFVASVFSYMTMALVISGVMAWWFGNNMELFGSLRDLYTGKPTILGWVVMFAPLGLVFLMGGMLEKLSGTMLMTVFIVYSALTGMSLSYIFVVYDLTAIIRTFFLSSAVFGIMAIAGYTTKTDLTKLGNILFIGLIGILLASLVNIFWPNGTMGWLISVIGVIVFTGLTAYDMQKIKRMGEVVATGTETAQKMALMGALSLYLDFINLFLMLLRLLGSRK